MKPSFHYTACSATEFQCASGGCIDIEYRCDYVTSCQDGSDEEGCCETIFYIPNMITLFLAFSLVNFGFAISLLLQYLYDYFSPIIMIALALLFFISVFKN